MNASRVVIEHTNIGGCYGSIAKIFALSQTKVPSHGKIAIKLNLSCARSYETGVTSDPRVVAALVKYLQDNCAPESICLVESDSTGEYVKYLYRWLGFEKLASELGVELINLSKDTLTKKAIDGFHFKEVDVPNTLLECDFFVSLAKLKRHTMTGISCILKNQFGCLPYKRKIDYHPFLDDVIVDANLMRKPDFSLVDGILVLEGFFGPSAGIPRNHGLLLGGVDPVAVDALCAVTLKCNPQKIVHLEKAQQKALGNKKYGAVSSTLNATPQLSRYMFLDFVLTKTYLSTKKVLKK
ncbi:MAG: DUF362 domain-containing protein [Candidatus Bathyarchaeota archaeon]|nr:DUF362 domain-containing protein [Candidatus Bathyarchaeota archaeon]